MILPFLLAALTDGAIVAAQPDLPPAVAAIAAEASERLLAGENLPPDYRLRLLALPPEERMLAIVYLRRTGLLRGEAFPLDDILRPVVPSDEATQ
ncbi:hypothetical protein SAMN04489859_1011104 [Paracoccus alcaliphilus]|uniref:Uncharacterized protein n=1 Tax=Paracoccus alcaliphilus TaxID=34002 RepID=A0A1H8I5S5_9RHOB|nr:hypothetical protein [Paracoccus alcaliphilus]WCR19498.1 hypothetical protein JHW40_07500 [Paracoccus alcaliphilus]SEN63642.1 hypothetical protein SAMN04489859_1011104 [Paracoccus alcaliphilus]